MKKTLESILEDRGINLNKIVPLIAATLSLTAAAHDGNIVTVNKADGSTIILPVSTGQGGRYRVFVQTTITSVGLVVKVANAADTMVGQVTVGSDDAAAATVHYLAGSTDDTVTLNGTTKGGYAGDMFEFTDIAPNTWYVSGVTKATGTEATPFSATVS